MYTSTVGAFFYSANFRENNRYKKRGQAKPVLYVFIVAFFALMGVFGFELQIV